MHTNVPKAAPLACLIVCFWVASCGVTDSDSVQGPYDGQNNPDEDSTSADTGAVEGPTWSHGIRAMVEDNCTSCHFTGGAAPFAFERYDEVKPLAPLMLDSMKVGTMPPWPADPDCHEYIGQRVLAPSDIEAFEAWVESGLPEGEPSDPIVVEPFPFEATIETSAPSPYTPNLSTAGDDYRCFLLDVSFESDVWITGHKVIPGSRAVHHVLVYGVSGEQVEEAMALDVNDAGEGYTCFGGPLPGAGSGGSVGSGAFVTQIAGWAPGSEGRIYPEDLGIPLEAGARIIMQVHFSAAGGQAEPDTTRLLLSHTTESPERELRTLPLAIRALDIPAGESEVTVSKLFTNFAKQPLSIDALTGHMHLLGKSIKAEVVRKDGSESCGLSIPKWDFDWQISYRFLEDKPVWLDPGDGIRVTCTYDNSQANQPVINGVQPPPRDVNWGDGSLDEMCLVYVSVTTPYAPQPPAAEGSCGATNPCFAESDGSLSAMMECEETSSACVSCALQAGLSCDLAPCIVPLASDLDCLTECIISTNTFGGLVADCLKVRCTEAYTALVECADPILQQGHCLPHLEETCGLSPSSEP